MIETDPTVNSDKCKTSLIDLNPFSRMIWKVSPDGLGIRSVANWLVHGSQKVAFLGATASAAWGSTALGNSGPILLSRYSKCREVVPILKNNEPYRYAYPDLMRRKFVKLQVLPKRTRAAADLIGLYRAAGLPGVTTPNDLPAGERRMLQERELTSFVTELYQPAKNKTSTKATGSRASHGLPEKRTR